MDFVRLLQPGIMSAVGGIVLVAIVAALLTQRPGTTDEARRYVKRVRNALVVLLFLVLVWQVASVASVNVIPRTTINRSDIDQQNRDFSKRIHEGE
jgi:hypothetical protein